MLSAFAFFKRSSNILILQLEVKNRCLYNVGSLSASYAVVKMDPNQNHNEGASSLQRSDIIWEHLNVPYFPPPPLPVEISQQSILPDQNPQQSLASVQILDQNSQQSLASIQIPQQFLAPVQIPQQSLPPTQVNAPVFHIEPQSFNPPLGSKIKILINELVHVDPLVCFNTLSLMNVLDQSLYGLANADDDTEVRVTFRNGMDPVFKKLFLDTAQKGKKFYKFSICVIRKMENLIFLFSFLNL